MASVVAASAVVAPAAFAAASSSVSTSESSSVKAFSGLKSNSLFASKAQSLGVQNGSRVNCMQVWNPIGQTKFETFSYLPPLTDDQIAKQVDYMIQQKLIPCLEFDVVSSSFFPVNILCSIQFSVAMRGL